jgi:hypothetical protein
MKIVKKIAPWKSFEINYDALGGFAPAARASPICDGTVLPVSIAEKFPERVMQKASQYAPDLGRGQGWRKGGDHVF